MKDFWTAMAPDSIISALSFVAVLFVVILLFILNTVNMNNAKPSPSSLHNSKPLKKKDIARKAKNKAKADRRIRRNPVEVKSPQPVKKIKDNSKPLRKNDIAREAKNKTKVDKRIRRNPVEVESPQPVEKIVEEEVMYDFLLKYLMTEDDLVQNGFPRPCPSMAGKAVMKMKKEQSSRDPSRRICQRCGKPFVVLEDGVYQTKEECVYHAGKLFGKKGQQIRSYSCCQGDAGSPGCCVGQVHVSDEMHDTEGFMTTIVSPLADQRKKIFSMDCEMCYTTRGLELTRITVVNWNLEVVYDTFVMPERSIVDYNTRFSGVTAELLRGVTTTIREVQAVLLSMIHKDTILVGHSLESDLKATKLIHSKVVDTSVVFPHRLGAPYKRALRNLMADHLKKIIQDSVEGHDSFEDAKACLELMRWKVKEDMKKTTRHKTPRLSVG